MLSRKKRASFGLHPMSPVKAEVGRPLTGSIVAAAYPANGKALLRRRIARCSNVSASRPA
jgi:hypothetical protein